MTTSFRSIEFTRSSECDKLKLIRLYDDRLLEFHEFWILDFFSDLRELNLQNQFQEYKISSTHHFYPGTDGPQYLESLLESIQKNFKHGHANF